MSFKCRIKYFNCSTNRNVGRMMEEEMALLGSRKERTGRRSERQRGLAKK
jgi:hypothetical protein